MASLGEELKRRREERGLSLRAISDETRIALRFLKAIESDDYSILPGGIFNRSFIRAFARQVDMDEEEAIRLYTAEYQKAGSDDELGRPSYSGPVGVMERESEPRTRSILIPVFILVLAIFALGGWALYHYYKRSGSAMQAGPVPVQDSSQNNLPPNASEPRQTPSSTPETSPNPPPETTRPESTAAGSAFTLRIEAREDCWISVKVDNGPKRMWTMKAGEKTEEFTPNENILLSVGFLPNVDIFINGRPAKLSTIRTTVVDLTINKENFEKFIGS